MIEVGDMIDDKANVYKPMAWEGDGPGATIEKEF